MSSLLMRTPNPYPDESPRGYVIRLTEANGYSSQSAITGLVGESNPLYVITVGWNFSTLRRVLGDLARLPEGFGYRQRGKGARETVRIGDHKIHSRHVGVLKSRICPDCIRELGYIPAAWDLKAFVACPIHGRLMLKHCPECGARIKYERANLGICRCGHDLLSSRTEPAPTELLGLMEVLWAKVHRDRASLCAANAAGLPAPQLLEMDLDVICRVIVTMASVFLEMTDSRKQPRSHAKVSECIPLVAEALSSWPWKFHRFLAVYLTKTRSSKAASIGVFQQRFSWLFTRLYKNLKAKGRQVRFLLREGLCFGYRTWDRHPIRLRELGLRGLSLPPKRYGSFSEAAVVLGVPAYTIIRWIANGRIPAVSLGKKRLRPLWRIDLERLARIKLSKQPGLKLRAAAQFIGVPYTTYRLLGARKLIPSEYQTEFRSTASIEDLENVRAQLTRNVIPDIPPEADMQVGTFLDSSTNIPSKVSFLEGILSEKFSLFGSGTAFRELWFDPSVIESTGCRANGHKDGFSIYGAMRVHKLSFYEARSIFVHLSGRAGRRGCALSKHVTAAQVEGFLRRNIPLRTVADEAGVYSIALRQHLEIVAPRSIIRLPAACGPKARGGKELASFVPRRSVDSVVRRARALKVGRR